MSFGDFFRDIGIKTDNLSEALNPVANAAVQYATVGLVGYEDGKLSRGALTRGIDESLGEITGRNMARDQAWLAEQRIKKEEEGRTLQRQQEIERRRQEDIQASLLAQGASRRISGGSSRSPSLNWQPLGEGADFLGRS
jgi:hypothetical protein